MSDSYIQRQVRHPFARVQNSEFFCSQSHGIRTIHHRDVQADTMKRYSLVVTCLICFVMRSQQGWECSYEMKLTPAQDKACQALRETLMSGRGTSRMDLSEKDTMDDEDWQRYLEPEVDEDLTEDDSEIHGDLESFLEEDGSLIQPEGVMQSPIAQNVIQARILDLLVSLYTHLPTGTDDKFFSPILRFLVLCSLKKTGQWLPPRRITQFFSILLFCGREIMMALMHHELLKNPHARYSE